ncbi:MAG TPA: magnesium/cobalt transporter CorA [Victivallales bacterium]|nr:magnesium/cobalt transporter CorA [Victivallales bacterium]HPO90101.1 magnesium/cobalt transporter CorA [Victivallales bacterium]
MIKNKIGVPPGTLLYTGDLQEYFEINVIDYSQNNYKEFNPKNIEECFQFKDSPTVTWINITGLHRTDIIEQIGKHYNLHPLVLEDILNIRQRPKIEYFDDYIFIVLKMLSYNEVLKEIDAEQVSIILGSNFVFTFQERKGDLFDTIRNRLRNNIGIIRKSSSDYLLYSLIDVIVDNYFLILEKIGVRIEDIEDKILLNPSPEVIRTIHNLKNSLIELRKTVWPLREILSNLYKGESELIKDKTSVYFRDVYDHTIQIIDTIETLRDIVSGLLDVYLSSISNRMNEIMKVLTIIATIFIPLTFIAGVYGMNFKFMPELEWKMGYPMVLLVMFLSAIGMLIYFKRKKWL